MNEAPTPRTLRRASSDERILSAAAKIFGSLGYSRATITDIAAEAGVSQGLVSQRFGSKENLLQEVFDRTRILTFYEEGNGQLPQAFFVLLDNLKREVAEEPDWFSFLSMLHTGKDTPPAVERHLKETFESTPLCAAIAEAQAAHDLPAGDPWDLFRVFFRNATNLIGWYHEFNLPMPENEAFLYAIQYSRRRKEAEALVSSQKSEIRLLKEDRDLLLSAVSELYPLIVYSNLSRNVYHMLEYDRFTTKQAAPEGVYDELIRTGASTIPSKIQREQFIRLFWRENVLRAYEAGKRELCLRHLQTGDDGTVRWIETRMLFQGCECGEILTITLSRPVEDEMQRLRGYGMALQNAELAAGAKTRFLSNLSHEVRTPMNSVLGYSELLKTRADNPGKVRDYAEKIHTSGEELMELLNRALEAGNLSPAGSGVVIRMNVDESFGGLLSGASALAEARNVTLDCAVGDLRDNYIYADEILLDRTAMSLLAQAVSECPAGGHVQVGLDQPEDPDPETAVLRLTVCRDGVGVDDALLEEMLTGSSATDGVASGLKEIQETIRNLGGSFDVTTAEGLIKVTCVFRFRRG